VSGNSRPSTALEVVPPDRVNPMTHRSFAAIIGIFVFNPPRHGSSPGLVFRFFNAPVASGVLLRNLHPGKRRLWVCLLVVPRVRAWNTRSKTPLLVLPSMPRTKEAGAPCTIVFTDRNECVKEAVVIDFYSSPLYGEEADDFFLLFLGYFHSLSISYFLQVNRP
jgi:hypothetical protein